MKAKVELFKSTLEKQGATIEAVEEIGSRQLAYRIDKYDRGLYAVIYFRAEGKAVKELERVYRINEDILRFIVVKYEKQVEVKAWENMIKKAKGEPHQEIGFVERERRPRKPRTDYKPRGEYKPRTDYKPRGEYTPKTEEKPAEAKPAEVKTEEKKEEK